MGVPNSVIVPFIGVEFDSSRAAVGQGGLRFKNLILGHANAAASMVEDEPVLVLNADDVAAKAGIGSQLHQSAKKWFSQNQFGETYVVNVAQPVAGSATAFDVTFTGTSTAPGEAFVYIDGVRVSVPVVVGETATDIAAALASAINDVPDRTTFTASSNLGTVTLTANYSGALGDDHDIRDIYFDTDEQAAGISVAITATQGAGAVDLSDAIDGIAGTWFNVISNPFTDTTNMGLLETELERRFGPTVQQDGVCYQGYADTAANTITFATDPLRNSQSMVLVDAYKYTQHPMYVASYVAGASSASAENDPGEPLHRITFSELLPPIDVEKRTLSTLNTLTSNGVMTLDPNSFGGPQTFGTVTMYLKNSSGINDIAYQYQNTMFILMRLRYDFVSVISTKYARARLADSAERVNSGLQVITPALGRAEAVSIARDWEARGLVENIEQFKSEIICQRSTTNPNRLEWILPPDLVNQFIIGSADMQFIL